MQDFSAGDGSGGEQICQTDDDGMSEAPSGHAVIDQVAIHGRARRSLPHSAVSRTAPQRTAYQ